MAEKKKMSQKIDKRRRACVTIPETGQKVWVSGRTADEIARKKAEVRAQFIDGVQVHDIPFAQLVVEWYTDIKKPTIKAVSTRKNWENAINLHLLPYIDPRKMTKAIRRVDMQRVLDRMAGMNATTIGLVLATLRHTCAYAIADGIIVRDPSRELTLPEAKTPKEKDAFTDVETERVLRMAADSEFGLFVYILYYTGMRRGEALGLLWGDVDFDHHIISVERDLDYNAGSSSVVVVGTVKNAQSVRLVPMPAALEAILKPLRGLPNVPILNIDGEYISYNKYRTRWGHMMVDYGFATLSQRYLDRCDQRQHDGKKILPPNVAYDYDFSISPHWFRHNYVTACYLSGLPAETTMQIVGHNDITTTVNIYTHLKKLYNQHTIDMHIRAAADLSAVLGKTSAI